MIRLSRISLLFFTLLELSRGIHLQAQPDLMQFRQFTPEEGLSSSSVTCFLQDHKGYMWIGTYYGLNRYDGADFKIYRNFSSDSVSLINNLVFDLHEDRFDRLWIGTASGLNLFDRERERFINPANDPSSPLYKLSDSVISISEDSVGNLWLATDNGIIYYNQARRSAVDYQYDPGNPEGLSFFHAECVFIDRANRLWVSTRKGLNLYDWNKKTFFHQWKDRMTGKDLSDSYFMDIAEDSSGTLWFGTLNEGLYRLNPEESSSHVLRHYQSSSNEHSLSANRIQSLFVDREGRFWIGTESGGLNLYNPSEDHFSHYRAEEFNPYSLNNESIQAIYEDNASNLWFGTFAGGINILKFHSASILDYQKMPGVKTGLSHNSVTGFLEDHSGRIWIATDGGGINLFDPDKNRFVHFNTQNSRLKSDAVLCMTEDRDHQIWIGSWGGGLTRFDPENGLFHPYTTNNSAIQDDMILSIAEGDRDELWLASFRHGLIRFRKDSRSFENFDSGDGPIKIIMVNVVEKLSDGCILAGTPTGCCIFNPENRTFRRIGQRPESADILRSEGITDIAVENDTTVWIGTQNGLDLYNPVTQKITRFSSAQGLPDNTIKGLVLDDTGRLWVSTNRGLGRFESDRTACKIFNRHDGLQGNEFNGMSACRLKDGRLLFGGTSGFNMIVPDRIRENKNIPPVVITDFRIFNRPVLAGIPGSPLKKHISETDSITLSYKQSVLTFEFAVMDFTIPEKNEYAYMLEGFEKSWTTMKERHPVSYTNLNPGSYTLRVTGSNNDGVWNKEGTSLVIKITPPFWRTWWFAAGLVSALAGILYLSYEFRLRQIKNSRKKLQHLVRERTRDLETANQELKNQKNQLEINTLALRKSNQELEHYAYMASHDLQEPLRMISSYLSIIRKEYINNLNDEGKSLFEVVIDGAERMRALIRDLLLYSKISSLAAPLSDVDCNALLDKVTLDLKVLIEESQAKIEVHHLPKIQGDPVQLERLFRNLLENAIKYRGTRIPEIHISAKHRKEDWLFSIQDNGIGIDPQYHKQIFELFQRLHSRNEYPGAGIGLAVCQKIVELHGGTIRVESEEGHGSNFLFTIPANIHP